MEKAREALPVTESEDGASILGRGREAAFSRSLDSRRWQSYAPAILVGFLGVLVTWTVFSEVSDLERQRQLDAFSEAARDRLLVIQREVDYSLGVVQDVGGFFDASRRVSRRQFGEFVNPSLKRNREVQALLWVPRVAAGDRDDFVAEARRGFVLFDITEPRADGALQTAALRPVHFPVLYVQPYQQNKGLLGLDFASDPDRLAVLDDAARARSLRVSAPESVIAESGAQARFSVFLPVYEWAEPEGPELDSTAGDPGEKAVRVYLRGFAVGIFLIRDLVDQALANLVPSGVDIALFTPVAEGKDQLFYVHSSRARGDQQPALLRPAKGGGNREYRGEIRVGDREWTAVLNPIPGYFEHESWGGYLVFVGGIAFTLLSVAFLLSSRDRAEEVRWLVAQRTLELESSNRALNKEITERRRAEEALQLLNVTLEQRVALRTSEAERRARDLEQFAYVASHDLKAPLRGIANLAGWLKEDLQGKLTAETGEQIELLRDRVARMNALVEGLLAYSRIGRTAGSVREVSTAELVADTIDSLAPPEGFEVKVAPGMPRLHTDRLQLGQVFANLIGNAIRHHDRKKGVIKVSGEDLGTQCRLVVEDDGPGIPEEYRDKVFMMFQTLKVKDYGGDTGIGLALVKKLVEEHGGTVTLEPAPKRGSRFSFTWAKEIPGTEIDDNTEPERG